MVDGQSVRHSGRDRAIVRSTTPTSATLSRRVTRTTLVLTLVGSQLMNEGDSSMNIIIRSSLNFNNIGRRILFGHGHSDVEILLNLLQSGGLFADNESMSLLVDGQFYTRTSGGSFLSILKNILINFLHDK